MTIELEDAKVKVVQFQKQCDEYLVVIVQQKRDADEQQKVRTIVVIYIQRILGIYYYMSTTITSATPLVDLISTGSGKIQLVIFNKFATVVLLL